jgi:hypothetical protein
MTATRDTHALSAEREGRPKKRPALRAPCKLTPSSSVGALRKLPLPARESYMGGLTCFDDGGGGSFGALRCREKDGRRVSIALGRCRSRGSASRCTLVGRRPRKRKEVIPHLSSFLPLAVCARLELCVVGPCWCGMEEDCSLGGKKKERKKGYLHRRVEKISLALQVLQGKSHATGNEQQCKQMIIHVVGLPWLPV